MIHFHVNCLPTLNVIGAYLDTAPKVAHAALVQTRLKEKMESLTQKGEDCLLIGDLIGLWTNLLNFKKLD